MHFKTYYNLETNFLLFAKCILLWNSLHNERWKLSRQYDPKSRTCDILLEWLKMSVDNLICVLPLWSWRQFPIIICSSLLVCWFSAKSFQRMHRDNSWKKEGSGKNIYYLYNPSVWWKFFELARIDFRFYGVLMHRNRRTASTAIRTFLDSFYEKKFILPGDWQESAWLFPCEQVLQWLKIGNFLSITSFQEPWKDKDRAFGIIWPASCSLGKDLLPKRLNLLSWVPNSRSIADFPRSHSLGHKGSLPSVSPPSRCTWQVNEVDSWKACYLVNLY